MLVSDEVAMKFKKRYTWILLLAALTTVQCAPSASPRQAGERSPPPIPTPEPPPPKGHAHWIPRIAPPAMPYMPTPTPERMRGPVNNNFGTHATAYLGGRRAGLIDGGRRWVFADGRLTPVAGDDGSAELQAVLPVTRGLGGGFVFISARAVLFADTFDGPLRKLGDDPAAFGGIAPRAVLLGQRLISTADGRQIDGVGPVAGVFTHANGMAVAVAASARRGWFTSDGHAWKPLAVGPVRESAEDGDSLLLFGEEKSISRLDVSGKLTPVTLSSDEHLAKLFAGMMPGAGTARAALDDAFEGVLLDAGWTLTGRSDDEWLGERDGQLFLAQARSGRTTPFGPKRETSEGELCGPVLMENQPLFACVALGKRLSVFQVGLDRGALVPERTIEVNRGVASELGTVRGVFPSTLVASASCEGDAKAGLCVRDKTGHWATYPKPSGKYRVLPFPGEVLVMKGGAPDDLQVSNADGSLIRTFPAAQMESLSRSMGISNDGHDTSLVLTGVLRTAGGLRMFHGRNPLRESAKPTSYAIDLPFDPRLPPTVTAVDGDVAVAGLHGLRLSGGKLWETDDGWNHWYEVPPPPTGVPRELAGAMCSGSGCLIDGWARIGWQQ